MIFWIGALTLSAMMMGVLNVLLRKVNKLSDPLSIAVYFNMFTALGFAVLLLFEDFSLPLEQVPFVLASAAIWFVINVLTFYAYKHTDLTLMRPIQKTNVLFVALMSVLVLGESLSPLTIAGTIIIFLGMVAVSWNRKLWDNMTWKGVGLSLAGAILIGLTAVIDKFNMVSDVSPAVYGIMLYLLPGIVFAAIAMTRKKELVKSTKTHWKDLAIVGAIGAVYFWIILNAYKVVELSIAYPVLQLSVLFTMALAYYVLKEKVDFRNRLIGAVMIVIGAILVTLGA